MKRMLTTALVAGLAVAAASPAAAQDDFRWSGRVAAGQTLEIKGVNGEVVAEPASGDQIVVEAEKRARRSDPGEVTIEVVEHAGGVTICAVYPTPRRESRENVCAPGRGGHMSTRDNDVKVDFTVQVPAGVRFVGRTVNGDVEAMDLRSEVEARTVNGSIEISTSGRATAQTVNGSIRAALGDTGGDEPLEFETVNGSITVELPEGTNADVSARTTNGGIESDFPLTVRGRFGPRRLDGTLGDGGRKLRLHTVNGAIRLRQR